jgi:hypothetical protein
LVFALTINILSVTTKEKRDFDIKSPLSALFIDRPRDDLCAAE